MVKLNFFPQIHHPGCIFLQNTTETWGNVVYFVTEEGNTYIKNISTIRKNRQEHSYNLPVIAKLLIQDQTVIANQELCECIHVILLCRETITTNCHIRPRPAVWLRSQLHDNPPPFPSLRRRPHYPCVVNLHWSPARETFFPSCMRLGEGG